MKIFYRILIALVLIAVVVGILYLLRNTKAFGNLWVLLSSLYGGAMIFFGKLKGFFTRSDSSIAGLEQRLADVNRIEKELIDTLMKERQVFKEKLDRLEGEYAQINTKIQKQETVLEDYRDVETWEQNVWEKLTPAEQETLIEETHGRRTSIEDYAFDRAD